MTESEKLKMVRTMVGDSDSDAVIETYLNLAGSKIINKAYPYTTGITEVPERYHFLQCDIAVFLLNKRGAEGQTSHKEGDITRTYAGADVPNSMLSQIVPHVGVFG